MNIQMTMDGDAIERLRDLAETGVSEARRRMVEQGMKATLESTIELNPVETGRSRAAWQAALGHLDIQHDAESTTASATNSVSYVPFLEYGTSRQAPFQMVRRSLAAVREWIASRFHLS